MVITPFSFRAAETNSHRLVRLLMVLLPAMVAAPAGAQVQQAITAQVQAEREAAAGQERINEIRDRTLDAAAKYSTAKADADSLERYNKQIEAEVRSQRAEIAGIERQLSEIETTNREVQPLMARMIDALENFVTLDVPFLLSERNNRIKTLKDVMARADVTISEKYRRILEAYQIELEYGRTMDAYVDRLGAGADARTVEFVRLGRVSLMYRTLDGTETGYWNANTKQWVVDPSYAAAVEQALKVARRQGSPKLITVPVPAPTEVRS